MTNDHQQSPRDSQSDSNLAKPSVKHPVESAKSQSTTYREALVETGHFSRVLISVSFLVTIGVLRFITLSIRHDWVPFFFNVEPGGLHIHHFVWGIVLLVIVGYLATGLDRPRWRNWLAVGYGIGAGLTLDEFVLLVQLDDVYWDVIGHINLAVIVVLGVFLLMVHDTYPVIRSLIKGRPSRYFRDGHPLAKGNGTGGNSDNKAS